MTFGRNLRLFAVASITLCLGIAAGTRDSRALDEGGGDSTACLPPTFTTVSGPDYVLPGIRTQFSFAAESDTGQVWFWIHWGDGSPATITPAIPSWTSIGVSHAWAAAGTYQISVYARNECGQEYAAKNVVVTATPPRTKNVLDDQRKKQIN